MAIAFGAIMLVKCSNDRLSLRQECFELTRRHAIGRLYTTRLFLYSQSRDQRPSIQAL